MFVNTSVFLIPIWFDSMENLKKNMTLFREWEKCPQEELGTDYLLSYAHLLTQNEARFVKYRCILTGEESVYKCEDIDEAYAEGAKIKEISLLAFGTGVAFASIQVEYHDLSPVQICNFIYGFKAVGRIAEKYKKGKIDREDIESFLVKILPQFAEPFFYVTAAFKRECLCYTYIKAESSDVPGLNLSELMFRLGRGYSDRFEQTGNDSSFDLVYQPYEHDRWSGSQEGLANLVFEPDQRKEDYFINNYKPLQLAKDYFFMYALLLNQRFASLKYIEIVAEATDRDLEKLNKRIIDLKTKYVFRVIANDMIYQNLYSEIYRILEIDSLLNDLKENEEQMVQYYNEELERRNKTTGSLLVVLSCFTVFSTLIDMSDFLGLFQPIQRIAKWISLCFVFGVIAVYVYKNGLWKKR